VEIEERGRVEAGDVMLLYTIGKLHATCSEWNVHTSHMARRPVCVWRNDNLGRFTTMRGDFVDA
jgi:hypothetical protein